MGSRAGYLKYGGNDYVQIWQEQSAPAPIRAVIAKWKREAVRREKQDYDWPLKHVGIMFEFDGVWYNLTPKALHLSCSCPKGPTVRRLLPRLRGCRA